jgi:hypothetical protein
MRTVSKIDVCLWHISDVPTIRRMSAYGDNPDVAKSGGHDCFDP